MTHLFTRDALYDTGFDLLTAAGLEPAKAETVADLLTTTDEMGVSTHGVSILSYYLPELANGNMSSEGSYEVISDLGATAVWDGHYQPGHWLMSEAIAQCLERVEAHGVVTLAIRRSHHIGCLSVLMHKVVREGFVCILTTSDPSGALVAPYGGTTPVLTPNPWGVGYPTDDGPVLIDICASITTFSRVRALIAKGEQFAHPWMLDGAGNPTTDPEVVNHDPKGSILPLGGMEYGHKGFGLGLMVEMLTQGLSGEGRSGGVKLWGGSVYLQVIDPDAFAGADSFRREMSYLSQICRDTPPAPGFEGVRLPGERALASMARARETGIAIDDEILGRLVDWCQRLDVPIPQAKK